MSGRGSLRQRGTLVNPNPANAGVTTGALAPGLAMPRVLVACQSTVTNNVVWIDPSNNTEVLSLAFAASGADVTPTGLAVTANGRIGYSTMKSMQGQAVAVFDTVNGNQIGAWIPTDLQPLDCKLSLDDRTLYVLCKQAKTLIAFDTATWARRWTANLSPASPQALEMTPDGSLMLVTDFTGGKVYPVTLATGAVGAAITVGSNPFGITITADGTTAYVANNGQTAQSVSVINIATRTVTATITGIGTPTFSQPLGIKVSPDQSTVWVTCKIDSTIVPISIPANTVGTPIPVASTPYLFTITDDGRYAYVCCYGPTDNVATGFVTVVDLVNKVKVTDIPIQGGNPTHVVIARDRTGVRSLNKRSGDVALTKADITATGLAATDVNADASGAAAAAIVTAQGTSLQKAANLSDLASPATARGNLGAAATVHAHPESDVTGLVADLATDLSTRVPNSTLSAKGSLLGASAAGTPADVPVGVDLTALLSDSSQPDGVRWGQPSALARVYTRPAGWLVENMGRMDVSIVNNAAPVSGTMKAVAIALPKGLPVNKIGFSSGTTALVGGTHQWVMLMDQSLNGLVVTNDDTVNAWPSNTIKPFTLPSTFTTAYEGLYYCGLVITATTPPSLLGHSISVLASIPPILNGDSTAGLSAPAALPFTAAAPVSDGRIVYCVVG